MPRTVTISQGVVNSPRANIKVDDYQTMADKGFTLESDPDLVKVSWYDQDAGCNRYSWLSDLIRDAVRERKRAKLSIGTKE